MAQQDPFARAREARGRDTSGSLEIQRIVRLAVVELPTPEEVEEFSRQKVDAWHFEHGGRNGEGFRLHTVQVGALLAWELYGGGLFPIGVGEGKTLITEMIAQDAFERVGIEKIVLFVPSQVYSQLVNTDMAWARKRVRLTVPFILMGQRNRASRLAAAKSGKVGCYVMPLSLLSTRDSEELLELIRPQLIIVDEAHKLKNREAARTDRVLRYMMVEQPKLVALSGTMTTKSVKDYHHFATHALRENCPLPIDESLAMNWGFVIDANADPSAAQTGPLAPLIAWARKEFPKEKIPEGIPGFRKAYKLRLNSAPGVVSSGDDMLGVSLLYRNEPVAKFRHHPQFEALDKLMKDVVELWRTPSGDEIEDARQTWRYLFELTAGFYFRQRWPEPEELVQRQRLTLDEAKAYIAAAQIHHKALQAYHAELRQWLGRNRRRGLDTPFLVGSDMQKHGAENVGPSLYASWRYAKELEFEGMPARISEPIRVCSYKVDHVVRWAKEVQSTKDSPRGGLVWYHHVPMGMWLHEALLAAGIDAIWCPSETDVAGSNDLIGDARTKDQIVVASMLAHDTGKNLQFHQRQIFAQFPRRADLLEQVVGRTHRYGQEADELVVESCNTLEFDHMNVSSALIDALYIHQTLGSKQKAIYGTYDPLPLMYPLDFLRERGFADIAQLDPAAIEALKEKFGNLEDHR